MQLMSGDEWQIGGVIMSTIIGVACSDVVGRGLAQNQPRVLL